VTTLFLTYEEVIEIHADQVARYGGSGGVRDEGLLRSALAQPEGIFGDDLLHPAVEAQAGAYLFHLVKNHPFIDGNKRAGVVCSLVFLDINGYELDPNLDDVDGATGRTHFEEVVVAVAAGNMSKEELIAFLKHHVRST
jgi:death-on-curing protein